MTSSGIPYDYRWRTWNAINDIDAIARLDGPKHRPFYRVARIILNDWRRWDGPGMEVDVATVKNYVRLKLREMELADG
jgi:hypothetical protein